MAGYSGTPLATKLGIKADLRVTLIDAPHHYAALVAPLPAGVQLSARTTRQSDIVHVFVRSRAELTKRLAALRKAIKPDAAVWVSWPKKAAAMPTDVTEDFIRAIALPMGFVDVKVCAVDDTWSGLKLVIRKALRPRA